MTCSLDCRHSYGEPVLVMVLSGPVRNLLWRVPVEVRMWSDGAVVDLPIFAIRGCYPDGGGGGPSASHDGRR